MSDPRDADLRPLLAEDAAGGWRAFIDLHTPTIVSLIERAGLRDRDEAMELYALVCEHLAANDCARLRRWNPAKGSLPAWLSVVVRRVIVDWVRSRAGRRRLFGVVKALPPIERRVFELFYWEDRPPAAIAEVITAESGRPVSLLDVLRALDAIHGVLETRHYAELLSMAARSRAPVSLDAEVEERMFDAVDASADVEADFEARHRSASLDSALAALPVEDAAIVRLHFFEGLSLAAVGRALHLPDLTRARIDRILSALKARLQPASRQEDAPHGASLA